MFGTLSYLFYPYGIIIQLFAIVHFIRRRPDTYWLWIILVGGGLGALVYIFVEALPDMNATGGGFRMFQRRRRIKELEALIRENPSPGNYEELGQLYLDDGKNRHAKDAYDHSITKRTDSPDPFYRRALAEIGLGEFAAARADLEKVTERDPNYDFQRAPGLLAHALAKTGEPQAAEKLFQDVLRTSTLTETQYNYAEFLNEQGRKEEARELANRILAKRGTMPGFLKRRERPIFRKAKMLLGRVPI
jgi:hypothetical protein